MAIYYRTDYISKIRESLKKLEIYEPEHEKSIEILDDILNDLDFARRDLREDERKSGKKLYCVEYTNKSGNTNLVKNPKYQIIADLTDRALKYLNELGLTPAGLKKIKDKKLMAKKSASKFELALQHLETQN